MIYAFDFREIMYMVLIAIGIDLLLGDPYFFPHPVRLMGLIINIEEKIARLFCKSKKSLRFAGFLIVIINIALAIVPLYFIYKKISTRAQVILSIYLIYTCISARMLHYEAFMVKKALSQSLEAGRKRVKYIVGRETDNLDEKEIIKATVETVSENTSDGIIAPLIYIALFGPIGGILYKFINTMDSMIAYKNEKYKDLGLFAAIVDDIFNYVPARVTGVLMCASNFNARMTERGFKIMLRDHNKHSSPNAGYPESAVAGILGIQLGGGNYYFKRFVNKPYIGDNIREIELKDIDKTVYIMYRTMIFYLVLYLILAIVYK
ncbi:MAG: adenosylcobinamide-phosphate synthase CbiB [Tissierellia bacterium]|nr:adenosylcobinamide-phosphate synthase CbiB [Tissierellia bacterium]